MHDLIDDLQSARDDEREAVEAYANRWYDPVRKWPKRWVVPAAWLLGAVAGAAGAILAAEMMH